MILPDLVVDEAKALAIAEDCKNILSMCVMRAGYGDSAFIATIDSNLSYDAATGTYDIDLNFSGSRNRASWYPQGYPAGAYDIVGLMNNGYKAKDYVYEAGTGHRSLKERKAARFIQMAASEIAAKYGSYGAVVTYNPKYNM